MCSSLLSVVLLRIVWLYWHWIGCGSDGKRGRRGELYFYLDEGRCEGWTSGVDGNMTYYSYQGGLHVFVCHSSTGVLNRSVRKSSVIVDVKAVSVHDPMTIPVRRLGIFVRGKKSDYTPYALRAKRNPIAGGLPTAAQEPTIQLTRAECSRTHSRE